MLELLEYQLDLQPRTVPLQHYRPSRVRGREGREDNHVKGEPQGLWLELPSLALGFLSNLSCAIRIVSSVLRTAQTRPLTGLPCGEKDGTDYVSVMRCSLTMHWERHT